MLCYYTAWHAEIQEKTSETVSFFGFHLLVEVFAEQGEGSSHVFVLDEDVVWHVQVLGGEIPDGEDPVADEQIADALGLLCRDGDDADLDLVAAADLAEARQVHDGLAALGGADDSVVFIKRRDDIEAVLRKAGIPQQRAAKLARADQNGIVCVAVAQKLLDIGDQRGTIIADLRAAAGGNERKILAHLHLAHMKPRRKRRGGDIDAAAVRHGFQIGQIGRQALKRCAGYFFLHETASFADIDILYR